MSHNVKELGFPFEGSYNGFAHLNLTLEKFHGIRDKYALTAEDNCYLYIHQWISDSSLCKQN